MEINKKQTDKEINKEKVTRAMSTVAKYAAYYRANIHRFAADYLGLKLKTFQKLLLFMMNESTNFFYLASRGWDKKGLMKTIFTDYDIQYIWPLVLLNGAHHLIGTLAATNVLFLPTMIFKN